jgi:short-subunit dehydrogenase
VCLGGTINGIVTILPRILAHGEGGHIVSTASMSGLVPHAGAATYVAAKSAVIGLMESMRAELEDRGVICSAFCPGAVQSNIAEAGKTRQARFAETGYAESDKARQASGDFAHLFMTKEEVGERVLEGILDDELFILTHSEFLEGSGTAPARWSPRCRTEGPRTTSTSRLSPGCSATRPTPPRSPGRRKLKA